jgi:glycosyltransferase involved in cell wall biosynthesis
MNLSILIPLLNEEESLCNLDFKGNAIDNYSYEIIFLDDGSTDDSWSIIEQFAAENPNVKGIRFMKNFGKSQALCWFC